MQSMIESVGESGLVLVEILDTKEARKVGLQGERLKVPSRTQRRYYVEDEDTKQALKEYLLRLLGDSKNLAVSDEMLAALAVRGGALCVAADAKRGAQRRDGRVL